MSLPSPVTRYQKTSLCCSYSASPTSMSVGMNVLIFKIFWFTAGVPKDSGFLQGGGMCCHLSSNPWGPCFKAQDPSEAPDRGWKMNSLGLWWLWMGLFLGEFNHLKPILHILFMKSMNAMKNGLNDSKIDDSWHPWRVFITEWAYGTMDELLI